MEKIKSDFKYEQNEILLYFFIYSFLGWALETMFSYFVLGYWANRGFLIGPICPIYGFGMLILILWLSKYKNSNIKLFFLSAIVLSFFEYFTGFALEAMFNLKWWDYTNDFLNINGRIAFFYSITWGAISIIVIKCIHPLTKKAISCISNKISVVLENSFLKLLSVIFIIDVILSTIQYLN